VPRVAHSDYGAECLRFGTIRPRRLESFIEELVDAFRGGYLTAPMHRRLPRRRNQSQFSVDGVSVSHLLATQLAGQASTS
jgi:hypothetical protein